MDTYGPGLVCELVPSVAVEGALVLGRAGSAATPGPGVCPTIRGRLAVGIVFPGSARPGWKAILEQDRKLPDGGGPFNGSSPTDTGVADRQKQQLDRGLVARERAPGLDDLAQGAVQALKCWSLRRTRGGSNR